MYIYISKKRLYYSCSYNMCCIESSGIQIRQGLDPSQNKPKLLHYLLVFIGPVLNIAQRMVIQTSHPRLRQAGGCNTCRSLGFIRFYYRAVVSKPNRGKILICLGLDGCSPYIRLAKF
jgi:hypothetical protein